MKQGKISRRKFVAETAGTAFGAMIVPRHVLGGPEVAAPSDRLSVAMVGAGGRGIGVATGIVEAGEKIVALVDVDFRHVDESIERRTRTRDGSPSPEGLKLKEAYSGAKRYSDFRRMLEDQGGIDAVVIATPDHTHAVIAKAAMELGKHVYVEKPLTHSVYEARVLRETARRTGLVTQMGNQGHSTHDARRINEWIQAGVIGPVHEVHVWTNRPLWPQGVPRPDKDATAPQEGRWNQRRVSAILSSALAEVNPAPSDLQWDLFLGPAPVVPYHPIYHPFSWRGWVDWGTGALGDMGAHLIDHPYWALDLGYPTSVETTSTPFGEDAKGNPASYPLATQSTYKFAARGQQPPMTLSWRDGGLMPPRPDLLPADVPLDRGGGVLYIGEKGILMHETYGSNPQIFPAHLREAAEKVPETFPRLETKEGKPISHQMVWTQAAKGQGKASSPFEYASRLTEVMLLGIVALRTGQGVRIHFDGKTGQITSPTEANQYLRREARKGWGV